MPVRLRSRRRLWPYCAYWEWWNQNYPGPPPPWKIEKLTPADEKEDLKEHIKELKDELKAAEEELKEIEKAK